MDTLAEHRRRVSALQHARAWPEPVDEVEVMETHIYFWLGGLSRVMLNYDVWSPRAGGADTEHSFKAMFQVAF